MAQGGTIRRCIRWTAAAAVALGTMAPAALAADASAWVKQVNDIYLGRDRMLPDAQRAEKILFPALSAMQAPPAELTTALQAALVAPGDPSWSAASEWAAGEAQQKALEAMKSIGGADKPVAFLHLYGEDQVPAEWKSAGLYVDLGTPPLLAAAQFEYLGAMDRLSLLTQVEATRLGDAGKATDALNLLADYVLMARLMADREFRAEMRWGMDAMTQGFERIRDVAWVYRDGLTDMQIKDVIDRLNAPKLRLDRLVLPKADRFAAEQVLEEVFVARQGPDPDKFGATMARLSAKDRPLMLFGESARWQQAATGHANTFDTTDAVADVYGGWEYRWNLPAFDKILEQPSDYERLDKAKFPMVTAVLGPVADLFNARQKLQAEAAATRAGLGVLAFQRRTKTWPAEQALTRPTYVKELERDPWSRDNNTFVYFVPIRDQPRGARELPKPHIIGVMGAGGAPEGIPEPEITLDLLRQALGAAFIDFADDPRVASAPDNSAELDRLFTEYVGKTATELKATLSEWRRYEQAIERAIRSNDTAQFMTALRDMGGTLADVAQSRGKLEDVYNEVMAARQARAEQTGQIASTEGRVVLAGLDSFVASLDDSTFVLYSAGFDQRPDWAQRVGEAGSDVLYWPPLLTLVRDHLKEASLAPRELAAAWLDFEPLRMAAAPKLDPSNPSGEKGPSRSSSPSGPPRRIN